jgi:hypothetical protein
MFLRISVVWRWCNIEEFKCLPAVIKLEVKLIIIIIKNREKKEFILWRLLEIELQIIYPKIF